MATAETTAKKTTPKAPESSEKTPKATPRAKRVKGEKSDSYAVFATGGKQYRVSPGDVIKIEKIIGPSASVGAEPDLHKEGDKLTFNEVLLIDNGASEVTIGTPFIKGSTINATLSKISRYKTVDVVKYKQKSRYYKKYGHRQPYFEITIDSIKQ
jgi:large subunit ribosomal protein L21